MVDKPSAGGQKRLKKNIIKQRAGKNTQVNPMFTRKGQTSGFTSTQTLKTRNHFESMSPSREPEQLANIHRNSNSILKKSSIDPTTSAANTGLSTGTNAAVQQLSQFQQQQNHQFRIAQTKSVQIIPIVSQDSSNPKANGIPQNATTTQQLQTSSGQNLPGSNANRSNYMQRYSMVSTNHDSRSTVNLQAGSLSA